MGELHLVLGRPKGRAQLVVQSVAFKVSDWTHADASRWLARNGFKLRNLDRSGKWLRARQREASEFEPHSFRTVVTHAGEEVTVNPKRKKRRARQRRRKAKVTRTRTTTTRIVRSNPKRRSRKRTRSRKARPRRPKRAKASSSSSRRYTLVFANRRQARALIDSMRLPSLRRAWRRALKPYPGGGAYIALPAWRLASGTARKLAAAALTRLAYEAGRRRKRFAGVGPRVAIAPR